MCHWLIPMKQIHRSQNQAKIHWRNNKAFRKAKKNKRMLLRKRLNLSSNRCLLPICSHSPHVSKPNPQLSNICSLIVFNNSKHNKRRTPMWLRPPPIFIIRMKTTRKNHRTLIQMALKELLLTIAEERDETQATHECSHMMAKSEIVTSLKLLHWYTAIEKSQETDLSPIAFNVSSPGYPAGWVI